MRKILSLVSIGMVALAPAIAAAQTGGASGSGTTGAGGSSSAPGSTGSSGTGSGSTSTPSTGPSTSPSASPSSGGATTGKSLSTITNQADCDKAGGDWQASTSVCQAKK